MLVEASLRDALQCCTEPRPRELPSSVNALMSGYVLLDAMRSAVLFLNAGS
jgi:hypothetical protein